MSGERAEGVEDISRTVLFISRALANATGGLADDEASAPLSAPGAGGERSEEPGAA